MHWHYCQSVSVFQQAGKQGQGHGPRLPGVAKLHTYVHTVWSYSRSQQEIQVYMMLMYRQQSECMMIDVIMLVV
jgi:hypothetical protein